MTDVWAKYTNQVSFVNLKDAAKGDSWVGWYYGIRQGAKGALLDLKLDDGLTLSMPYSGALRSCLETHMKVRPWDYIKIEYNGKAIIEKGQWAGSECHQFNAYRNDAMCGEAQFKHVAYGAPLPKTETEKESEIDSAMDGLF